MVIPPSRSVRQTLASALLLAPVPGFAVMPFGLLELGIILLVVLVLFGKRIPEAARGLGRSITSFKAGLKDDDDDRPGGPSASDPPRVPAGPSNESSLR